MDCINKLKPYRGAVYREGQTLPESTYGTATGRRLYTVQQLRASYARGGKESIEILKRCRNMLSHPAHWSADEKVLAARSLLYLDTVKHLNCALDGMADLDA